MTEQNEKFESFAIRFGKAADTLDSRRKVAKGYRDDLAIAEAQLKGAETELERLKIEMKKRLEPVTPTEGEP